MPGRRLRLRDQGFLCGRVLRVLTVVMTVFAGTLAAAAENDGTVEIRLLVTNNANGKLVFCNCPADTLAGIGERVGFIEEYRARHDNVVLVDAGGYFGLSAVEDKGPKVLRLMAMMGYDAIGVGDQELFYGLDTFLDIAGHYEDMMVSASILGGDGTPVFDPVRVVEVDGIEIGITGIASDDATFRFFPEERKNFTVADPFEAMDGVMEVLEDTDAVVVLSQLGYGADQSFAEQVQGIDIIAGSHSQTLLEEPVVAGDTWILQTGKGGGRIGEVMLTFTGGRLTGRTFRMIELAVPPNEVTPEAAAVIETDR